MAVAKTVARSALFEYSAASSNHRSRNKTARARTAGSAVFHPVRADETPDLRNSYSLYLQENVRRVANLWITRLHGIFAQNELYGDFKPGGIMVGLGSSGSSWRVLVKLAGVYSSPRSRHGAPGRSRECLLASRKPGKSNQTSESDRDGEGGRRKPIYGPFPVAGNEVGDGGAEIQKHKNRREELSH